jgi:biotin carboxyl carrier protein
MNMKYIVKIADRTFEVEIKDIHAHPVIAYVDGQEFEVHPENGIGSEVRKDAGEVRPVELPKSVSIPNVNVNEMVAPLPGTLTEIFVKAGDVIESGQVIVIIEAMKMKNSIRSTRAGKVTEVFVSAGQAVAHKQPLVRFE